MYLNKKQNFLQHTKEKTSNTNRGVRVMRKLRHILPKHSIITVFKSFARPHLDYCDIIYDQPSSESFCNKTERVQDNAAFAIMSAIRGTSENKMYKNQQLRFFPALH